jgi:hypothetical protein
VRLDDSGGGPRVPQAVVIVKVPHRRGCPDGPPLARRSAATVVHCYQDAFRAGPGIISIHGDSFRPGCPGDRGPCRLPPGNAASGSFTVLT